MARTERTRSILVVDDEAAVRSTIRRALESQGHRVIEAPDGMGAMELFGRERAGIRLVVLDIVMPGMSGWDVLTRLKSQAPGMPVLLISGYARAEEPQEYLAEQADGVLGKPFELSELIDSVNRLL